MSDNIKFKCACGKTLAAPVKLVGKKAKCSNCGQVVVIPTPKAKPATASAPPTNAATKKTSAPTPAASPPKRTPTSAAPPIAKPVRKIAPAPLAPLQKSIFDEEDAGDLELDLPATTSCPICGESMPAGALSCPHCGDPLAGKTQLKKSAVASSRKIPSWAYFIPFGVYFLVCTLVGLMFPAGLLLLTIPLIMLHALLLFIGFLWYFIILVRDHPGEAAFMFFGILGAAFLGLRGSSIGRAQRSILGKRDFNPAHKTPRSIILLGICLFAGSAATLLIVGFTFGTFSQLKANRRPGQPAFAPNSSMSSPFDHGTSPARPRDFGRRR